MARNEEDEKAQASYRKSNQKRREVIRNRDQDEAIAIEGERNRINEEREEAERLKEQERAELEAEKRENDDLRRIRLEEARINQERRQRQEQIERTRDQEQANAEAARKAKYDSDADEAYQEEGERNEYRGSAKGKIANFFGKGKYQKPKKDDDSDDDDPKEAKGKGSGLILPKIEFTQKSHLLFWIILPIAVILFLGWYNDDVKQGIFWATFYIFLTFIAYGFVTGVKDDDKTKIWVAVALFIWFLDLWPSGKFSLLDNLLGPPYAGFELPLINEIIKINWLAVFTSGVFFVLLYIDMVRNIIKREYTNFWLAFGGILISNWIIAKYVPNSFKSTFDLSIWIPGSRFWNTILAFCIIALLFLLAYKANKKWMQQIPNFFTNLFMIFVISFFWLNNGWAGNVRALIHAGYIALFGFLYIAKRENQVGWHLLLPLLLIVDFFGYGVLWNSGYLWAQFIPPLVLFVVGYCYFKSENSYALATFIFIVTVILILSLQEIGTGSLSSGELNFIQRTDSNDFTNFFDKFFEKTSAFTRKGLSTATGGYSDQYFGNVENNQFEPLGVFFDSIRTAQPKFYDDEPVTIWGTIKSRTLSDPANINFSCARWEGSKRIWTQTPPDLLYPNNPFTVYTSEEKDVECTFNKEKNNLTKLPVGTNKITLSAQYNFETNAYQKVYFIDKERYRAMTRENLDPLKEFGITDTNPIAIYTNGPVRIATAQADPLIKVSPPEQGDLSPGFGIALENRNKITDKDGKAVGEWEGKIKKIRELVLLLPKGITLLKKSDDTFDCSPVAFKDFQGANCTKSCEDNVGIPCQRACKGTDCRDCETYLARCQRECDSLFKNDAGTVAYNGYQLDTASIRVLDEYKDIDKYKTFNCRLDVNPAVLDNTPITTRYFRIKARYDYSLDKTFSVTVEASPLAAKESASSTALPDYEGTISTRTTAEISGIYYNPSNANEVTYSPMVNSLAQANGISYYLIKAMIQVEDGSWNPNAVNIKVKIPSYGLMQITDDENVPNGCKSDWKTNPESNVECGIMVLKSKYNYFNQGSCTTGSECKNPFATCSGACLGRCTNNKCEYQYTAGTSTSRYYSGIWAAVRAYNGWGSNGNDNYVEDVKRNYDSLLTKAAGAGISTSPPTSPSKYVPPASSGSHNAIAAEPYQAESWYQSTYGATRADVETQLVNIDFQGKPVQVHQKAVDAFRYVDQDITTCNSGYNFWADSSRGTYAWRPNLNNNNRMSLHSYGIAIDINPTSNPNTAGGNCVTNLPTCAIAAFKRYGFVWGCDFTGKIDDAMHFEWRGMP